MSIEILSAITSAVVAVTVVIASVITTIINNRYQTKQQAIIFAANQKLTLYQEFFDIIYPIRSDTDFTIEDLMEVLQIISKIYLVCDEHTREQLDELRHCMRQSADPLHIFADPQIKQINHDLLLYMRNDLKPLRK